MLCSHIPYQTDGPNYISLPNFILFGPLTNGFILQCTNNIENDLIWFLLTHDDVIKWKHFPRHWPFVRGIHRSLVNSSHKGQWRGALMFSLICVWINGWVNNREAGDLRRYRSHCDVTVMAVLVQPSPCCEIFRPAIKSQHHNDTSFPQGVSAEAIFSSGDPFH